MMVNQNNSPYNRHYKDKQLKQVYEAFKAIPMTMLEADKFSGIMRSNICWHINSLKEQGRIAVTKKRKCAISGRLAKEFTSNPDLFPKSNQLKLF